MNVAKNVLRLFKYGWKAGPILICFVLLFNVLAGLVPNAELILTGNLIHQLEQGVSQESWIIQLLPWILALILLNVMASVMKYAGKWSESKFQESMKIVIKRDLFKKTDKFNLDTFEDQHFHNRLLRAHGGMEGIFSGFLFQVFRIIEALAAIGGLVWIISKVHWLCAAALLLGGLPVIKMQTKVNESLYETDVHQSKDYRLMNYFKQLVINRDSAIEMKIFGLGHYFIDKWKSLRLRTTSKILSLELKLRLKLIAYQLIQLAAFGFSLILLIFSLRNHAIHLGEAVIIVFALMQLQDRWEWFVRWCGWIQEDYIRLFKDLFSFFDLHEDENGEEQKHHQRSQPFNPAIELKNVSFHYPFSEAEVLKNINLKINDGEKVVIVGENGSGKTTLVKLILGYYQPTQGEVIVNGQHLQIIENKKRMWENSSSLFQDYVKYHLTLKDNIAFGDMNKVDNLSEIQKAAKNGGADQVLEQLNHDFNGWLGPTFGGKDLSGGQWQKVATSRLFLKDSKIMILDEPSAVLDPSAESDLYEKYVQLSKGKTVIFISHRLGIARLADRIIVLKQGQIVEEGSHEFLLKQKGYYYEMWETQSSLYKNEAI